MKTMNSRWERWEEVRYGKEKGRRNGMKTKDSRWERWEEEG